MDYQEREKHRAGMYEYYKQQFKENCHLYGTYRVADLTDLKKQHFAELLKHYDNYGLAYPDMPEDEYENETAGNYPNDIGAEYKTLEKCVFMKHINEIPKAKIQTANLLCLSNAITVLGHTVPSNPWEFIYGYFGVTTGAEYPKGHPVWYWLYVEVWQGNNITAQGIASKLRLFIENNYTVPYYPAVKIGD